MLWPYSRIINNMGYGAPETTASCSVLSQLMVPIKFIQKIIPFPFQIEQNKAYICELRFNYFDEGY